MRRLILILALLATPLAAVEPDEVLDDPVLEQRARAISEDLRCMVCQNESIDESNAPLARDMRLLVRERLVAGDTDDEVRAFVVERYGEFALFSPPVTGANWILWGAGPAMMLIAALIAGLYLRGRSRARPTSDEDLSSEEQARLKALLGD
ncbi:MAG: cytochrome c-type biogenesis protein [Rhodosalinus sp.]|uniref:cytochrome c-type biogenesis protein n=1 Tax=Rhodosalinus sp. TaxID=2047741 RepID=UPI00397C264B